MRDTTYTLWPLAVAMSLRCSMAVPSPESIGAHSKSHCLYDVEWCRAKWSAARLSAGLHGINTLNAVERLAADCAISVTSDNWLVSAYRNPRLRASLLTLSESRSLPVMLTWRISTWAMSAPASRP